MLNVPLTLSPRPANAATPGAVDAMRAEQMSAADEYWEANFAQLLEPTSAS